jgi:hypothetical protein
MVLEHYDTRSLKNHSNQRKSMEKPASQPTNHQPASLLGGKVSVGAAGWTLGCLRLWGIIIMTPDLQKPSESTKIHEKASQPASQRVSKLKGSVADVVACKSAMVPCTSCWHVGTRSSQFFD